MTQSEPITHEQVTEATARFLAAGGHINLLPDTVEEQIHVMRLETRLEGTGLEGMDGRAV